MKHIPSNFTLEETVKYCELTPQLSDMFEKVIDTMADKDNEISKLKKQLEILLEQNYFHNELLEKILSACIDTTTHKDLVKYIHIAYDDSGVEL